MTKDFLAFTYDEPGEDAPPLWTPGDPRDKRVSIVWKPSIACTAEQVKTGHSLTAAPGIPWKDINIAEIRVESRKAYEILNRIVPDGQAFIVRINPPRPGGTSYTEKSRGLTIFTNGDEQEFTLAAAIAKGCDKSKALIVSGFDEALVSQTEVAVFVHRAATTADHLHAANAYGAKIVTSDAGAAGEWLARFGIPGRWHVARTWDRSEFLNMIRDLRGEPNEVYQTSAVDLTPFMKAWGNV